MENSNFDSLSKILGSGALPGKMLPARIIENNRMYAYFRSGQGKCWLRLAELSKEL